MNRLLTAAFLSAALSMLLSGCSSKTITKQDAASTPAVPLNQAKKPLTAEQMQGDIAWTNDEFNQAYSAFQSEEAASKEAALAHQHGSLAPVTDNKASFNQVEEQILHALTDKTDSINNSMPKTLPNPVSSWWFIQSDVDATTNFALAAVTDMAADVNRPGDASQIKKDVAAYQNMYNKTIKEIQTGKVIG